MNEQIIIGRAFEARATLTAQNAEPALIEAVNYALDGLDNGTFRVAEKVNGTWQTHAWLKQAVLLSFKLFENTVSSDGVRQYFDKVPLKFSDYTSNEFEKSGIRVVPDATVRRGAYVGTNTILMPSYINIGAYVDEGCMIDTWATVGSCAQVGKNVHLSGGAGLGGVLEPLQASPTIIEDNCFIGARSEIVEGVRVCEGSVIGMGVFIGQSTKIYHREKDEILFGEVPPYSVVVPGTLPDATGKCALNCAVIVKQVDAKTRAKTSLNDLLRPDLPRP